MTAPLRRASILGFVLGLLLTSCGGETAAESAPEVAEFAFPLTEYRVEIGTDMLTFETAAGLQEDVPSSFRESNPELEAPRLPAGAPRTITLERAIISAAELERLRDWMTPTATSERKDIVIAQSDVGGPVRLRWLVSSAFPTGLETSPLADGDRVPVESLTLIADEVAIKHDDS